MAAKGDIYDMKTVNIFFGEGYEEIEALTVVDLCRRAGIDIQTVSITGDKVVTSSHKIPVVMDALFEEIDFEETEMIVLPGGMPGTRNLEAHEGLMDALDRFYESGQWVAAICAAPSIFGHRGYLKGRKACSFPAFEDHLEGAEVVREPAIRDGHLIMGRGMGCAIPFALEIVAALCGEEKAEELAHQIVYR